MTTTTATDLDQWLAYVRQSKGSEASIEQQDTIGRRRIADENGHLLGMFRDEVSASIFTTKARDDYPKLLKELDKGRARVVWVWESSRGDRDAERWLGLLRRCRTTGTRVYVELHRRYYDMTIARDWKALAEDGVDSQYESMKSSDRILRSVTALAALGQPHGWCPYGYRRNYHFEIVNGRQKKIIEQVIDPETAPVVVRIMTQIAKGQAVSVLTDKLNADGIPSPKGGQWERNTVRTIAMNPAYVAKRRHKGELFDAVWPALVDDDTYHAAVRVLSDPERKAKKPGGAKYLLSYLIRCGVCGGKVQGRLHRDSFLYSCHMKGCAHIVGPWADEYVTDLVLERLAEPDVHGYLSKADDTLVIAARTEAQAKQDRLDKAYALYTSGELSDRGLAKIEADLTPQINAANRQAQEVATHPALREMLDEASDPDTDIAQVWGAASLAGRREVIGTLLAIELHPYEGKPQGRHADAINTAPDRITVTWRDV